jgi:cytochrome c peroxidase
MSLFQGTRNMNLNHWHRAVRWQPLFLVAFLSVSHAAEPDLDFQIPSEKGRLAFKNEQPIVFLTFNRNREEWLKLPTYWNRTTEKVREPESGRMVERGVVKIKVPLGLTQPPPIPVENPPTVAKWLLGKRLYFDPILSSDGTVSCASCHSPQQGYTTNTRVSVGIRKQEGGMNGPTVFNSAYNALQFWDGRAMSLEDQAQGPVQNPVEMFDGTGHAWEKAVARVRKKGDYVQRFQEVFGTPPTRDAIAKAIATYERTVLIGNSIHDRAEVAMAERAENEGTGQFKISAKDYETVLKAAFAKKDEPALKALGLDPTKDAAKIPEIAKSINNGRLLFFDKARCNACHVGENLTDNAFHNLGVGVKDGKLPASALGRFGSAPTGHKNPELIGAFKTPTLRGLLSTRPYMHDGSEDTLEKVVDLYDRGGNANEFLDAKMRDDKAETAYRLSQIEKTPYKGPEVKLYDESRRVIVPLKLNLTADEKKDLVRFLQALQGDPVDAVVADPSRQPTIAGK